MEVNLSIDLISNRRALVAWLRTGMAGEASLPTVARAWAVLLLAASRPWKCASAAATFSALGLLPHTRPASARAETPDAAATNARRDAKRAMGDDGGVRGEEEDSWRCSDEQKVALYVPKAPPKQSRSAHSTWPFQRYGRTPPCDAPRR